MDVVVPSPVISPEIPIMKEAIRRGLPIWSEVEVACRVTDADVIGITGTNDKTTTTTLGGEIMKATGRQTVVGGNIGYGLSAQADNLPEEAVVVAELSSFQLEFTHSIKAKAATILNITPDHLDRHHTMEGYAAAKERIFLNQDKGDYAVLNYDDERVRAMAGDMSSISRRAAKSRKGHSIRTASSSCASRAGIPSSVPKRTCTSLASIISRIAWLRSS